jgi:hypothetical protein
MKTFTTKERMTYTPSEPAPRRPVHSTYVTSALNSFLIFCTNRPTSCVAVSSVTKAARPGTGGLQSSTWYASFVSERIMKENFLDGSFGSTSVKVILSASESIFSKVKPNLLWKSTPLVSSRSLYLTSASWRSYSAYCFYVYSS